MVLNGRREERGREEGGRERGERRRKERRVSRVIDMLREKRVLSFSFSFST